jgi:ABC-type Mn2+/Zn2+ transport system permease subunit
MERVANVYCKSRLVTVGVFSIALGLFANMFGRYIMDEYDKKNDQSLKAMSISLFSLGVVFVFYGFVHLIWNDRRELCSLSLA